MLVHTCSHTLFVRARVCAQDAGLTVLPFLQPMSTTIYVYPSAWNTRMEMCHTCRWECDSCSKAWVLRRFIYCFNDAVCFIFMYFVRNDEIKTVNLWLRFQRARRLQLVTWYKVTAGGWMHTEYKCRLWWRGVFVKKATFAPGLS